jgi:protease-4
VRIPLTGVLMRGGQEGLFGRPVDKVENILLQIRAARNDPRVKAVILEINSPGGAITASDEIYHALRTFRESEEDRRVVAFFRDVGASGAYYVAMSSDWLIAEPTSIVGSIGVLIQSLNWKELSDKIGVHETTIKSGPHKDLLNPFDTPSQEEIMLLQELVDSMYMRFFRIVREARGLDGEELRPVADGRILTADQALEHRLIDETGYWADAVARTAEMLQVEDVRVVRYERQVGFFEWFSRMQPPGVDYASFVDAQTPRPMYLWKP